MVKSSLGQKHVYSASLVKRITAFLIDFFLLNIFVLGPFGSVFERFIGLNDSIISDYKLLASNPEVQSAISLTLVFISILFLIYFVKLQLKFGQTIGMMIMKIYVIKIPPLNIAAPKKKKKITPAEAIEEARKFKVTFFDVIIRNLFLLPFFPFIILWIVEPIFMMMGKDNLRFLERLSRTRVVEINEYTPNNVNTDPMQRWF